MAKQLALKYIGKNWPEGFEIVIEDEFTYELKNGFIFGWRVKKNKELILITGNHPIGVSHNGDVFTLWGRVSSLQDLITKTVRLSRDYFNLIKKG